MERRKGFTFIELMIVLAIISILSLIGVSSYQTIQTKSRDAKRKADLSQIGKALEMYAQDMGVYPGNETNGAIIGCDGSPCAWGGPFSSGETVYMAALPKDPKYPTRTYVYEAVSNGTITSGYRLYARLENPEDPEIVSTDPYNMVCTQDAPGMNACNFLHGSTNVPDPTTFPGIIPIVTNTPLPAATQTPTQPPASPTPTPTPACHSAGYFPCTSGSQCCSGYCFILWCL